MIETYENWLDEYMIHIGKGGLEMPLSELGVHGPESPALEQLAYLVNRDLKDTRKVTAAKLWAIIKEGQITEPRVGMSRTRIKRFVRRSKDSILALE